MTEYWCRFAVPPRLELQRMLSSQSYPTGPAFPWKLFADAWLLSGDLYSKEAAGEARSSVPMMPVLAKTDPYPEASYSAE